SQTSFLYVAVSNDADPTHGFQEMHKVDIKESSPGGTSFWGDFPRAGYNADAYVYTVNMFAFPLSKNQFDHVQIIALDKAALLDGNNGTFNVVRTDRTNPADNTLVPATVHAAAPGDPMWLVEENNHHSNVRLVQMTNVLSATPGFVD